MRGEGGIVAAAVFRVKNQSDVQQPGFQIGVLAHRPNQTQDIFRCGELRKRIVEVKTLILEMRALRLIGICSDRGQTGNQVDRLTEHVADGSVFRFFVEAVHGENAPGHLIHDAGRRIRHDHVAGERRRKFPELSQQLRVVFQLALVRKFAEQQQIAGLLVAEALFPDGRVHQVFHVDSSVVELARNRDFLFIFVDIVASDVGYVGQSHLYAGAVFVSEAHFYVISVVKGFVDVVVFMKKRRDAGDKIVFENPRIVRQTCRHIASA